MINLGLKNWIVSTLNKDNAKIVSEQFDLPSFLSVLLDINGISTEDKIQEFFSDKLELSSPFTIRDMDKAVSRIAKAIDNFEKICVYGDYDTDGVTATSLLYSYLQTCGANVIYYIPARCDEGYGLNISAVEKLSELNVNLIITVDNGIASVEEVEFAKKLGIDIVITDHHKQHGEKIPNAVAVVNPHRLDCNSQFKDLSGVGVAFKLIWALEGEETSVEDLLDIYSDLVVLGTVADLVPLCGENRSLVKAGLKNFSYSNRVGILELIKLTKLKIDEISSLDVAFFLAPRINAVGRLGLAEKAVRLLISEDEEEALDLAEFVDEQNETRKTIEKEIYEQIKESLESQPSKTFDRIIVIEGDNWHPGVIGIVASKITEDFGKPSIIISKSGEQAVASGRSVEGFSLHDALFESRQFLTKFGGHPMAVGFSIKSCDIDDFRKHINEVAKSISDVMPLLKLPIACKLNISALNIDMVKQIQKLEPFGCDNPKPVFGLYSVKISKITAVGQGNHLRLELQKDATKITAMNFNCTLADFPYEVNDIVDLAVTLEISNFKSRQSLSVFVREIRMNGIDYDKLFDEKVLYEKIKRDETVENITDFIPTRTDFIYVYKLLVASTKNTICLDVMLNKLEKYNIGFLKLSLILDVMEELGIIQLKRYADFYKFTLNKISSKVDLASSRLLMSLNKV